MPMWPLGAKTQRPQATAHLPVCGEEQDSTSITTVCALEARGTAHSKHCRYGRRASEWPQAPQGDTLSISIKFPGTNDFPPFSRETQCQSSSSFLPKPFSLLQQFEPFQFHVLSGSITRAKRCQGWSISPLTLSQSGRVEVSGGRPSQV